jgi:hypothetical protein
VVVWDVLFVEQPGDCSISKGRAPVAITRSGDLLHVFGGAGIVRRTALPEIRREARLRGGPQI